MKKILMWNVRGAGSLTFRRHLIEQINIHNHGVCIIVETKVGGDTAKAMCETLPFTNHIIVDARGFKGGIWVLWNEQDIHLDLMRQTDQEVHTIVKVHPNNTPCMLSAIYASPVLEERKILWNNLTVVAGSHNLPWMCIGDFNEILNSSEKKGGRKLNTKRANGFLDCLNSCGLIDMGFVGSRFTWLNNRSSSNIIFERLDRSLCNPEWRTLFLEATVHHLVRTRSDHCPILVDCVGAPPLRTVRPFRFEKFWFSNPSLRNVVNSTWSDP